jgi:multiple sugar transport system substrate-binding protein
MTWDEMLHLRDRLGYRGRPFYVFQGKPYEGLICNFAEHLAGEDPTAFSKNSMPLEGEAALRALQRMVGFLEPGGISPAAVTEFDEIQSYRYMLDSNAVFVRGWPNFPESFRSTYADTTKLVTLGWAALPHVEGHRPVAVFGGWNLMIAKSSENRDAASEFIRFVQSIESQKIMYEMGGYIPVNEAVYADSVYLRIHPDLAFKRALLDFGFHRPALEGYTRISDLVSHAIHRALKKELAPREALRRAAEDIASDPGARR